MDKDRQIRLLIPPFSFMASLLLGWFLGGGSISILQTKDGIYYLALLLAGGFLAVPLGFLITSISIILLKMFSLYDVRFSQKALEDTAVALHMPSEAVRKNSFYAIVTLDHDLSPKGIHEWTRRRWSAFNAASHSCVALALAFITATISTPIHVTWSWGVVSFAMMMVLARLAYVSWNETKKMLEFQAQRLVAKV